METIISILQILGRIIVVPFRAMYLPVEQLIRWLKNSGEYDETGEKNVHRQNRKIVAGLKWLLLLPLKVLELPVKVVKGLFSPARDRYLYLMPAVAVLSFLGFTLFQAWFGRAEIANRYRVGAFDAIKNEDFALAKTYFTRLMDLEDLNQRDEISWAMVLGATGENEEASEILDSLAPETGPPGFAPAHRQKVAILLREFARTNDRNLLGRIKRHLDCGGKESPDVQQAWATYYFAIGDVENVSQTLVGMTDVVPRNWLALADLCESQGKVSRQARALDTASKLCKAKIELDPFDVATRIDLARVLTRKKDLDGAEQVLLKGLQLKPDEQIKVALSQFYLVRYDRATEAKESFAGRFAYLQKAMQLSAANSAIYDRLTLLFMNESDEEGRKAIRNEFLALVASDKPSAMAHFALSNLYQAEGDSEKGVWHLEQAYALDKSLAVVANNLAWMLSHQKEPDLDKALEFAEQAVANSPVPNPDFLDTYGTVLMLRKEFQEAISEFEKAIGGSQSKQLIHRKLAECYRQIGRPELAEIHERNASKTLKP